MSGQEKVGSAAEEAARLFEALQDWARDSGGVHGVAEGLRSRLIDLDEHLATGGRECRWCPLCQAISLLRETTPEVRSHLTMAASSLLQAAAGLLEARASRGPETPPPGVWKTDLDDAATEHADEE
jgi:hypothetical protein